MLKPRPKNLLSKLYMLIPFLVFKASPYKTNKTDGVRSLSFRIVGEKSTNLFRKYNALNPYRKSGLKTPARSYANAGAKFPKGDFTRPLDFASKVLRAIYEFPPLDMHYTKGFLCRSKRPLLKDKIYLLKGRLKILLS